MKGFYYYTPIVLQKVGYVVFFFLFKIFVSIEVRGRQHLAGLTGPLILAPNHTSELDVMAMPLVFGLFSSLYPIYFVSNPTDKYKTFGWRGYLYGGTFFNMLGGYAVFSGHRDYKIALDNHIRLLNEKQTVCIFPEGKLTRDGQMNPARGGLGFLAYTTGATVVPVGIDTFYNMSLWDFLLRRRKVVITISEPMKPLELIDMGNPTPTVEDFQNAGQKVLERIREMM